MQSMGVWSLNHDITTSLGLNIPIIQKSTTPDLHRYNSVRVDPYAHSHHIKVLKHFVYILYGCGMQSMGVWSLNHDITTPLGLRPTPIFQKFTPTCKGVTV
jgi:hypothetical protein